MGVFAICLTIGIVSGFALLLYGVFFLKSSGSDEGEKANSDALEKIKMSVEEADNTLSNINSVSSLIIEEIDIKYKELLFLYQMLEEKKKELLEHTAAIPPFQSDSFVGSEYSTSLEIMEISRKIDEVKRFPRLHNKAEIIELYMNGCDITQIAKQLGIGKGEVKLILGLSKAGAGYE